MGLCEILGYLAGAVAAKYDNCDSWHNLLIHVLRSALIYRDAGRLDAWDEAYRHARGDIQSSSTIVELLDAIAELGSYNMYGAFDVSGTRQEHRRFLDIFQASGVPAAATTEFSDW